MARQGRKSRSRLRAVLLAASAATLALLAGITVATGTSARAATMVKGDCAPYLSVTPGGVLSLGTAEPAEVFTVRWAGSSSGWSPPGSLRIIATAFEDGVSIGSVTGTEDGTSVSTPPGGPVPVAASEAVVSVSVTAYGPAGKVTCSAEQPVVNGPAVVVDGEPGDTGNGGSQPARGSGPAIDQWGGAGWGLTGTGTSPALGPQLSWTPYFTLAL